MISEGYLRIDDEVGEGVVLVGDEQLLLLLLTQLFLTPLCPLLHLPLPRLPPTPLFDLPFQIPEVHYPPINNLPITQYLILHIVLELNLIIPLIVPLHNNISLQELGLDIGSLLGGGGLLTVIGEDGELFFLDKVVGVHPQDEDLPLPFLGVQVGLDGREKAPGLVQSLFLLGAEMSGEQDQRT